MIPCHCTSVCKGVNKRKDAERLLFSSSANSLSVWRGVGTVIWLQVLRGFCHWVALHSPAGAEMCFPEWKREHFCCAKPFLLSGRRFWCQPVEFRSSDLQVLFSSVGGLEFEEKLRASALFYHCLIPYFLWPCSHKNHFQQDQEASVDFKN